jgi:hypothetical protein
LPDETNLGLTTSCEKVLVLLWFCCCAAASSARAAVLFDLLQLLQLLLLLLLQGPVRFGAGVVVSGDVTLECDSSTPVTIQHQTYSGGVHKVTGPVEETAPAGTAPPALQPSFA